MKRSSLRVPANGLEHHVVEWTGDRASKTAVLVHGFMDAGGTWDRVAPALADAGMRVLAPDMRGFGEGARAPRGSYYHFVDYVFDLADVIDGLAPGEPITLVGHSMGGTAATLFAGTFPERVSKLANLEGLGPPDMTWEAGPIRMRRWIEEVRAQRARGESRTTFTKTEALKRLAANHPAVPEDVLEHCLPHLVRDAGGGAFAWRNDSLHRTTSPVPFFSPLFMEFAKRVACPVLVVSGGPTGFHPSDEDARIAAFPRATRAEIADAGHMMHWTRPDDLARLLLAFFAG
jgi:pimeloyl-ACP methyl ester carboxylesterase